MTAEETKMWEGLATHCNKMKAIGWKRELIPKLDIPVDIVVIKNNRIESQTVWRDITDFERAKRLIAREQAGFNDKVVAIKARKFWLGDIINNCDIIL